MLGNEFQSVYKAFYGLLKNIQKAFKGLEKAVEKNLEYPLRILHGLQKTFQWPSNTFKPDFENPLKDPASI
jgi:hypothetical protein